MEDVDSDVEETPAPFAVACASAAPRRPAPTLIPKRVSTPIPKRALPLIPVQLSPPVPPEQVLPPMLSFSDDSYHDASAPPAVFVKPMSATTSKSCLKQAAGSRQLKLTW